MRKIFFINSLLLLVLILSGCGSQKQIVVAKKKETPSWYLNPPSNTMSELYAVGSGRDKKSAITDALSMLASNLSVSVSSKFSSSSIVKEGTKKSATATYKSESQSEVKKIRISNYEVLKSKNLGFKKYAVLIKSNKNRLFKSMKQEVEQEFNMINSKIVTLNKYNIIKQINFYKEIKEKLSSLPYKLLVMHELNNSFNTTIYLSKLNKIDRTYEELLAAVTFSIRSNKSARNLKAPIVKGISSKKFTIKDIIGKKHFTVNIYAKIEKANAYGFTLARSAIEINVKDYQGSIIGSNKINLVGQSTQGYDIAKENIAIKLNELIKKDGISKVIGLEF